MGEIYRGKKTPTIVMDNATRSVDTVSSFWDGFWDGMREYSRLSQYNI